MKLKLLRGTVYNACDMVSGPIFQSQFLNKVELPQSGTWRVNLKNGTVVDENNKKLKAAFGAALHRWFVNEIRHANIAVEKIESAEIAVTFNFASKKPHRCRCEIKAAGRTYANQKPFSIMHIL